MSSRATPSPHPPRLLPPRPERGCRLVRVQVSEKEQNKVGMVVIRGNSVVMIEALEKLWGE